MAVMPLELWSSSGVLLFSAGMRIARQLGEFYTGTTSGSVNVPQLADTANSWFLVTAASGGANYPMIKRNGAVISWSFVEEPNTQRANMLILWGVK